MNLFYTVTERLKLGFEWNPAASELLFPSLNWILQPENEDRPMISFGTSSDRIFSPEGTRSYYLTFAKGFRSLGVAPYVSVNYSEWEDTITFPFGANVSLGGGFELLGMNDGRKTHVLLSKSSGPNTWSLITVDVGKPRYGISWSVRF